VVSGAHRTWHCKGIAQRKSVERREFVALRGKRFGLPAGLAVAALGVVFGDIGTSPLYTLKTCFDSANAAPTAENALGIVSLLVWALFFVVCLKYVSSRSNGAGRKASGGSSGRS
jgi:K+ transporter